MQWHYYTEWKEHPHWFLRFLCLVQCLHDLFLLLCFFQHQPHPAFICLVENVYLRTRKLFLETYTKLRASIMTVLSLLDLNMGELCSSLHPDFPLCCLRSGVAAQQALNCLPMGPGGSSSSLHCPLQLLYHFGGSS